MNQRQDNTDDIERSWLPIDLAPILDGTYTPPKPTVGHRADGVGLFYPAKVHTVASASEAGKTWLALAAAFQEIQAGNHVVYIDFEDSAEGIAGRLLTFGLKPEQINNNFHYIRPTQSIANADHINDLFHQTMWINYPTLAVIDGITEAMTMHGLDVNSNSDIARFGEWLPRKLASPITGNCATVCLDHVVKSSDGPTRYALGGVHKLNGLDGAAYVLESREPFGVGVKGCSTILLAKDRPGQLRRHGLRRNDGLTTFGELVIESHDESYTEFEITPATAHSGTFRPTIVMAKISKVFEDYGKPMAQRQVLDAVGGKAQTARLAFSLLRIEGYLSDKSPHKLIRPFRADADAEISWDDED